jgi:hypothetical protein
MDCWHDTGSFHSFEPRYEDIQLSSEQINELGDFSTEQLSVFKRDHKKYIYDICTKCGKVINRT